MKRTFLLPALFVALLVGGGSLIIGTQDKPEVITIQDGAFLLGVVEADRIVLPFGVRAVVSGDVTFQASVIEIHGHLSAADCADEGASPAPTISLVASKSIGVSGQIVGGKGGDALPESVGVQGGTGSYIYLSSPSTFVDGAVTGGNGGPGGHGQGGDRGTGGRGGKDSGPGGAKGVAGCGQKGTGGSPGIGGVGKEGTAASGSMGAIGTFNDGAGTSGAVGLTGFPCED